ncbi:helix-turn-helix domain-containing protein [Rhizobium sp. TAL182]|uniref:helix-turn-helix domain-containing protein n=1 Tax=Rhizobium sp. TAL182 TaxID=2020313 RepID=UPI000A27032E|nr:helix-turn-helix domain-containing protein [Rhizobium sp. TAL182]
MITTVRQYSSAAENIRQAHIIRQRLLRPPVRKKPAPSSVATAVKRTPRWLPMWQWGDMQFDAHMAEWRKRNMHPTKDYMRRRCKELGITMKDLCGPRRTHPLVDHRQLIMWELKTIVKPDISYPELGRLFGRDHTTCLYAVRAIAGLKARGLLP